MAGKDWLAHAPALRALVAALVNDSTEHEDLVQETWLRALCSGGFASQSRGWWSSVIRNLARDRARERSLREQKEREAAREEEMPSEVEVVERLEIAQRVAAELARLDEPYRSTIHLRYFEGLGVEAIAQRSKAPVETVRARLRRGLALLRERMDRACGGDRSTWCGALSAIAMHGKPVSLATSVSGPLVFMGGVVMSIKVVIGVVAAIVLGVGFYCLRPSQAAVNPQSRDVAEAAAPPTIAKPVADKPGSVAKVIASEGRTLPNSSEPRDASSGGSIHGLVRGPDGTVIDRCTVQVGTEAQFATDILSPGSAMPYEQVHTNANGVFDIRGCPVGAVSVRVRAPAPELAPWTGSCNLIDGVTYSLVVDIVHGVRCHGIVSDPEGKPASGAEVSVKNESAFLQAATRTDRDGRYELIGLLPGDIRLVAKGESGSRVEGTVSGAAGAFIEWNPILPVKPTLRGQVIDQFGAPIPRLTIIVRVDARFPPPWASSGNTDEIGRFAIPECPDSVKLYVEVAKNGAELVHKDGIDPRAEPVLIQIVMGSVSIRGIVLGADGQPLKDVGISKDDWINAGRKGVVGSSRVYRPEPQTGAFSIQDIPHGLYTVFIRRGGNPLFTSEERELIDGDRWDMGEIRLRK